MASTASTSSTSSTQTHKSSGKFPSMYQNDSLRETMLSGIHMAANDRFAEAESLFTTLADAYPASPIGPLFAAATIHAQMLDEESPARYNEFERWLTQAEALAENWNREEPSSGEPEFVLGAALGYDAVYESRWGGWFAALKKGLRAKNHFADAIARDTTLVDAYLGIGNYNYWKSVKTDFINWLPIVADERSKGLEQLRYVISDGVFSKSAARVSLCWALMHDGDFDAAIAHADTLQSEYPNARVPLWIRAYANFNLYRWANALELYGQLEQHILATGPGNYYNLIDCAYYEAQCYNGLGQWTDALDACHKGLAYPAPLDIQKRQKDKLNRLGNLQNEIKEMVAARPH